MFVTSATDSVLAPPPPRVLGRDDALLALVGWLKDREYRFISPTPATHRRVIERDPTRPARDLRDVFGWNRPFATDLLPDELMKVLAAADAVEPVDDGRLRARYRVASVVDELFLHSSYPTSADEAVFLGPDSYRFAAFVTDELERRPPAAGATLVDIGTGTGVGAIAASKAARLGRLLLTDINPQALDLARVNARAAGIEATCLLGAGLDPVNEPVDLVIANPPYMIDAESRSYRDGGDMHGARITIDMATAAMERLAPAGRLCLYSGSAIMGGEDHLQQTLRILAARHGFAMRYRELDPDVFGEELETEAYREVDRIAVIGAVLERHSD
ncbi:MAG: class I SAM-dependent methyltransferase [Pseudomonadota bacterium]